MSFWKGATYKCTDSLLGRKSSGSSKQAAVFSRGRELKLKSNSSRRAIIGLMTTLLVLAVVIKYEPKLESNSLLGGKITHVTIGAY